ncbi:MAG: hypothetical protein AUH29_04425 [Candidatus Rokubacteria bacterium 13_1_40CM_69_27]|nr:MAG: hypothetical protein AUH29_04425 [Candidatus Rokubacteria bacterium 13_1_40CM_69_27]OLC36964.1 MAG: hypothetical protein AUH81_07320 [Candidatus Rokubacteria bacterium 13_1_40CM_4_69_5]OLE37104.1 MAG: hypothetical protein AUG00_09095 [Candidatus Rokubacteria bacterium 13_1_20CM_2_70_7]
MTEARSETWLAPSVPVLLIAVLIIAGAEVGGASMVKFKLELARWARGTMLARPDTHGLVGVRDVDEQILDEALVKFDAGLRLFHMHAEGMGTIIIVSTMVATTLVRAGAFRRAIVLLITVGGAGYPLGYLLWSALIPFYGIERGKTLAEWMVWIPFGGAAIVALWMLAGALALRLVRR